MIFITVGEQLPFDRLIQTVDQWAAVNLKVKNFAQIGQSELKPSYLVYKDFITPEEYYEKMIAAELIVAHAGMGTIISALELGKPILVMPRQAVRGECRNNHQFATARRFLELGYLTVAYDELELLDKLNEFAKAGTNDDTRRKIGASSLLLKSIREFIET